jgi:hypothetical protein
MSVRERWISPDVCEQGEETGSCAAAESCDAGALISPDSDDNCPCGSSGGE